MFSESKNSTPVLKVSGADIQPNIQMEELLTQIRDLQHEVHVLRNRVALLEGKNCYGKCWTDSYGLNAVDSATKRRTIYESASFGHYLAIKLDTVAGLKQTVKGECRLIRYIWAILVTMGIGATFFCLAQTAKEFLDHPTATNVDLQSEIDFAFPPLYLCPEVWFDVGKARDLGMSLEMIKYSLSYPEDLFHHELNNTSVRDQFYEFYKQHKYKSLVDFYKSISPDLKYESAINRTSPKSRYRCLGCTPTPTADKTVLDSRLCQVFYIQPIERGFGMYSGDRTLTITYTANRSGLVQDSPNWFLYFPAYTDTYISTYPKVTIQSSFHSTVKFHAQKFITVNKLDAPCHEEKVGETYSALTCMAQCHNNLYKEHRGCLLLWLSNDASQLQPWDTCNFMDKQPPENLTLSQFFASDVNKLIDKLASDVCVKRCPRECNRIIMETTLQLQATFTESERKRILEGRGSEANSTIDLTIKHGAVYQGGLMVLSETSTYSTIQLINNIGGTLGLFVGGTLMTFAQLILHAIDYCLARRVGVMKVKVFSKSVET